jgi:hypothetical protein
MATVPSIKGSVFTGVVEDTRKLLESSGTSERDARRWLEPEDFALLEQPISVSSWYDIRSYTRMSGFLREIAGGGSNEYLRQLGRQTARRLIAGGIYAQMEYLSRVEVLRQQDGPARVAAFGRDLRILNTMSATILNFSRWTHHPDTEHANRWFIEITEARDFPEVLAWRSDGFVNEMASRHSGEDLWTWSRIAPDHIRFRMIRDI